MFSTLFTCNMKTIQRFFIISSLALFSGTVAAQNTYSGYFLDNYTYRYEMNPAFGGSKGFVSMPVLGNMNIAVRGSLHYTDLIYKNRSNDGRNVLFTNSLIPVDEAWVNSATATASVRI